MFCERHAFPARLGVYADQQRLKQVIVNLLSNAIKYNHQHGEVSISVSSVQEGFVRINIVDTGCGIKQEDQARVFEPFLRAADSKPDSEGT